MTEAPARRTPGTPCWVSLIVHGLTTTQEFYGSLFDWEFLPGPDQLGPYVRGLLHGAEVAGIGQLPPDRHLPIAWTTYLASDDADATAEAVRSCGGTVAVGPLDGTTPWLAIASDPGGAVFGIWQGSDHLGTMTAGVPGTPVWNELVTRETSMVAKFYQTVFGYETEAVPLGRLRLPDPTTGLSVPVAALHGVGHALPRDRGAALDDVLRGGRHRSGDGPGGRAGRAGAAAAARGVERAAGHGRGPGRRRVHPRQAVRE